MPFCPCVFKSIQILILLHYGKLDEKSGLEMYENSNFFFFALA